MKPARATFLRKFGLSLMYLVLFIALCSAVYFGVVKLFTIQEITVVGSNIQVSIDQRKFPSTLLFFPSAQLRAQILADNPILADIRFEKKYPHTLMIVPTLRKKAALLITPSRLVFIDEGSIVLSDADSTAAGVPQITSLLTGLHIGQKITDQGVIASLAFVNGVRPLMQIETLVVTEDGVITAHTGNLDILFTQDANVSVIVSTLQTLVAGFRIKGTLPKVIDLRFDKPVVTF